MITIDGPAGAGKSTVAREIARRLGIFFLDTGAMYRALTLKVLRQGVDLEDEDQLVEAVRETKIDFGRYPDGKVKVLLDAQDVTEEIRTMEVTNKIFYIARAPRVRAIVVKWQRDIGSKRSVVAEGRDVGTVVFPKATHKFYLDADPEERSRRRIKELREKGQAVDAGNLKKELEERDHKDLTRRVGPLKRAEDAVVIDSTHLCADEVVEAMLGYIQWDKA